MQTKILAAFAAALMLSACGGGGGGTTTSRTPDAMPPPPSEEELFLAEYRSALGGGPLDLSATQIRSILESRQAPADRLFATDTIGLTLSGPFREATTCSGNACVSFGERVAVSDLDFDGDYQSLMTRNGVSVGAASSDIEIEGEIQGTALGFGGWLDHNAFFVSIDTFVDADNVATAVLFSGASMGNDSGSNPTSGSATWTGVMVGMDTLNIQGLQGDATLTADFTASNLDASFTNIHDDELARRGDILFDDVPMTSDGFASRANGRIEGTFYGPDHAEAGGIFERGNTIGAFGAKRQ